MAENGQEKKLEWRREYVPIVTAVLTMSLYLTMEIKRYRLASFSWYPLDPEGLLNMLIVGPALTFLIPWNGWILFVPFFIGLCCKSSVATLTVIFFAVWLGVALLSTSFNFDDPELSFYLSGLSTYFLIFVLTALGAFFVHLVFKLLVNLVREN